MNSVSSNMAFFFAQMWQLEVLIFLKLTGLFSLILLLISSSIFTEWEELAEDTAQQEKLSYSYFQKSKDTLNI